MGWCGSLCRRHNVPPERVLGHNEVPGAATGCPGRHMDMMRVRAEVASTDESGTRIGGAATGYKEKAKYGKKKEKER
ncbi:N-acetylmuramoyl-L-alanine amidase [Neomoorella humiferrea]|uniref:N-acetylmuramoyl-L-alanine amidase n=1 Tax=Neomoorella humiferrea TaxID=676965 RepID=UPI0030D50B2B